MNSRFNNHLSMQPMLIYLHIIQYFYICELYLHVFGHGLYTKPIVCAL